MERFVDFSTKIAKVREALMAKGFDAIEIKSQTNFSYLTRGRGFIGLASVLACGSLLITEKDVFLLSENIEAQRLYHEQLGNNPAVTVMSFPWDEPTKRAEILSRLTAGLNVATEADMEADLFKLRTVITAYDLEDYRKLCQDTAAIVEGICMSLQPGISEYELAGEIAKQLWTANIEPITLLIAFDERALQYRHPVMTAKTLKNYALVAVCGRQNGLIASVTRDVLIHEDESMIKKHEQCANVFATFLSALSPGSDVSNIYELGINAYAIEGYPLEHKEHHQGGLTGFVPRELRANIGVHHEVRVGEVYAFNPSLQGSKCEDTYLVNEDGIECMTYTGNYHYVEIVREGVTYKIPTVYVSNVHTL